METMYKTKAAAKAQATRQLKKYGTELEVYGIKSTGFGLRRVKKNGTEFYIGPAKQ
jgi:hypothetical protein